MDLNNVKRSAKDDLNHLLVDIDNSKLEIAARPIYIKVSEFDNDRNGLKAKLKEHYSSVKKPLIYVIELDDLIENIELYNFFRSFKMEPSRKRKLSKDNKVIEPSSCLYVGSSLRKNFINRIMLHLGHAAKGTYAMHMRKWLPKETSISISTYSLDFQNNSESSYKVLEFLEQSIWSIKKPMFGKRSGLL